MTIYALITDAHDTAVNHGWWDGFYSPGLFGDQIDRAAVLATVPEKLCLIHSEVSEALEDYRVGKLTTTLREDGKPEGLPSELADVVIRIADLCGALDIDLQAEIVAKLAYNKTRSHRHGGKVC